MRDLDVKLTLSQLSSAGAACFK
ncbi:hypothetical protein THIOKS12250018 [Thiocapsa sp. KS1]|nr:hypothetical protein THIOKS12250018 [Thiocapsa sp. KS1]